MALYVFSRVPGDYQAALGHALGWERTKGKNTYASPNFETTAAAEIPKMSRATLGMLLLACSLAEGLCIPGYCDNEASIRKSVSDSFLQVLKRHGVDLAAIRNGAKSAAKVQKASKASTAKKGKKGVAA